MFVRRTFARSQHNIQIARRRISITSESADEPINQLHLACWIKYPTLPITTSCADRSVTRNAEVENFSSNTPVPVINKVLVELTSRVPLHLHQNASRFSACTSSSASGTSWGRCHEFCQNVSNKFPLRIKRKSWSKCNKCRQFRYWNWMMWSLPILFITVLNASCVG